jgi:L-lactate dehydrogenase complex protein LldF
MSEKSVKIAFEAYTNHIPQSLPQSQCAANRVLNNRSIRVADFEDWEAMRQAASDLRLHTLLHLDAYLEQVEQNVTSAGGQVHWASTDEEARQIVLEIAREHAVQKIVKVKSMATEEIGLNQALQRPVAGD